MLRWVWFLGSWDLNQEPRSSWPSPPETDASCLDVTSSVRQGSVLDPDMFFHPVLTFSLQIVDETEMFSLLL